MRLWLTNLFAIMIKKVGLVLDAGYIYIIDMEINKAVSKKQCTELLVLISCN